MRLSARVPSQAEGRPFAVAVVDVELERRLESFLRVNTQVRPRQPRLDGVAALSRRGRRLDGQRFGIDARLGV